ncbi:MAG: Ig domain-containing protein [Acidobacteriota bacterium]
MVERYSINGGLGNVAASGCAAIAINPASSTLPTGVAGQIYSQQFTQSGSVGGVNWSISAGQYPPMSRSILPPDCFQERRLHFGTFNNCAPRERITVSTNGHTVWLSASLAVNYPEPVFAFARWNIWGRLQSDDHVGGTSPFNFQTSGSLPAGLRLSPTGLLSGTPTISGSFNFTVTVIDAVAQDQGYAITIGGRGLMFLRVVETDAFVGYGGQ